MWNWLLKKLKGWKTFLLNTFSIWLSAILWVLPDIIAFVTSFPVAPLLPPHIAPYVVMGLGILNLIIRKFTDGKPGAWAGKHSKGNDVPSA